MSLNGKIIVITGAAGTLCSAVARQFSLEGAKLALIGRTAEKVEKLANELRDAGGEAWGIGGDVTSEETMSKVLADIETKWGQPDILINGAGGKSLEALTDVTFSPAELTDDNPGFFNINMDALRSELELNIQGTVIPSKVFGAAMARKGGGNIINFASMNSYRPLSKAPGYALAKAGIINFTQWLAAYLAPAKIRVNAVAPGFFVNDRSRKLLLTEAGEFSERGNQVIAHTPMHRFGEATEIYGAVRWLVDADAAAYVTGICLPVDGGFLACSGL